MKRVRHFGRVTEVKKHFLVIVNVLFFLVLLLCHSSLAATAVSGKHLSTAGKKIVLALSVRSPAPSSLIVEQYISPGNSVISTSPPAKKVNKKNGKIKWLFRNISPGRLTITTLLQRPLKGTVNTFVRYRDPATGQYIEKNIHP